MSMGKKSALLALALGACVLAGCGGGGSEETPPAEAGQTPAALVNPFPYGTDVGDYDLNGDGTTDVVNVAYGSDEQGVPTILSVTVNGTAFDREALGYYAEQPSQTTFFLTDLDTSDKQLEIALEEQGPSDDPATFFFAYDGTTLRNLGSVDGHVSEGSILRGDGTVSAYVRLSVLQTWWADCTYRLTEEGIQVEPQDYFTAQIATHCQVKQNLKAYRENNTEGESLTLGVGSQISLVGTDNQEWVKAETSEGDIWLHLIDGVYLEAGDSGSPVVAQEVLDGLYMAD